MALSLTSGNTAELLADYGPPVGGSGALEFNEMAFRRALVLELKRTGISKRPFIFMIVSLAEIPAGGNGYSPRKRVVESIASSIRDTDMLGWYRHGRAVGVLFTEITGPLKASVDSIMERLNAKLATCLSAEEVMKLSIAVYLLPEKAPQTGMIASDRFEDFDWTGRGPENIITQEHPAYH